MPLAIAAALALSAVPNGGRLVPDRACFAIYSVEAGKESIVGSTLQVIARGETSGHAVWRVTVHQRVGGRIDMRDRFVLDARTLRPLALETQRNGVAHAGLAYSDTRVAGYKVDREGVRHVIDEPLKAATWEGNLYGPVFAALPLAPGRAFALPFYQYDRGFGTFTIVVKGSENVATPDGIVDAWVLDAGPSPTERLHYLIAKETRRELGYRSPEGGQRLGGDCSGLD